MRVSMKNYKIFSYFGVTTSCAPTLLTIVWGAFGGCDNAGAMYD